MRLDGPYGGAVPRAPGEIRLFAKLKNEANRIEFFLNYYRELGVDRFCIVDNGSTDGSLRLLRASNDVHLFFTSEPLSQHALWMNELLRHYGVGHWCLVVDLDELFVVPLMDRADLRVLAAYSDEQGFNAVEARLVDMYSEKPICETVLEPGEDPRRICRFFDGVEPDSPHFGGVRRRAFQAFPYLMKVPFFHFDPSMEAGVGMHNLTPHRPADILATLFHFKFISQFPAKVREAVAGGHFFQQSSEYKLYQAGLEGRASLTLREASSLEYRGDPEVLIEQGYLRVSDRYRSYVTSSPDLGS